MRKLFTAMGVGADKLHGRFVGLSLALTLLLGGCAAPLSVVTPPVYWPGALEDKQGEVYTGIRGGIPTSVFSVAGNAWYVSPFVGVGGQGRIVRGDAAL